jgi:hypothetical protein
MLKNLFVFLKFSSFIPMKVEYVMVNKLPVWCIAARARCIGVLAGTDAPLFNPHTFLNTY